MKLLTYSVAVTIALSGLTWHNAYLWKQNRALRASIERTVTTVVEVEKEVIKIVRADASIPSEAKERIITAVRAGTVRIKESSKVLPPPAPVRLGLHAGYDGRRIAGGLDYQLIRRGRWSLNLGASVTDKGTFGPSAGIYFRPTMRLHLTTGVFIMYNIRSGRLDPYTGVRLRL